MSRLTRLTNAFGTQRLERDLQEELQFHLDERVDEYMRQGRTREEAEREVHRRFGSQLRVREASREAKATAWVESLAQDARFGWRMLVKNPVSTVAVMVSLSCAIGAASTAFSLVDALMLKPLPVPHPEQLAFLAYDGPGAGGAWRSRENVNFSYPAFEKLRPAAAPDLELYGVSFGGPRQTVRFDGATDEPVRPQWINGGAFATWQLQPALGRFLTEEDEWPVGPARAVLSDRFWESRFRRDPGVIGRQFSLFVRGLDAGRYEVAGVAPKGFHGAEPGAPTDIWLPLTTRMRPAFVRRPEATYFQIHARWREGADRQATGARLQKAFEEYRQQNEAVLHMPRGRRGQEASLRDYRHAKLLIHPAADISTYVRSQFEKPLWIVTMIVGLVLLAACANVGNLLVARAVAREREFALRMAIGAGRWRVMRQMFVESSLLAAGACVLGWVIAQVAGPAIVARLGAADFPAFLDLRPDRRLLGFLVVAGGLATLLFGLLPALRASSVSLAGAMRAGALPATARLLHPLVALQVALTFVVLHFAGLLGTSLRNLERADLGFAADRVTVATVATEPGSWTTESTTKLLDELRREPGVEAASLSTCVPAEGRQARATVLLGEGRPSPRPVYLGGSPGFLATFSIPLRAGRDFAPADLGTPAVLVSEAFVRQYLGHTEPLGFEFQRQSAQGPIAQKVIGVVADFKVVNLHQPIEPLVIAPYESVNQATLSVRGEDLDLTRALGRLAPSVRITSQTPYPELLDGTLRRERLLGWLSSFLGVLALLVAALGLIGLLHFSFTRAFKEIGLRLAIGASPWDISRRVAGGALRVLAAGVLLGAAVSYFAMPLIEPLLFQVRPWSWGRVSFPLLGLTIICTLATVPAVIRALRVDPRQALRQE